MIVVRSPLALAWVLDSGNSRLVTDPVRGPIILDLMKCFHNVEDCFTINSRVGQPDCTPVYAAVLTKSTVKVSYHNILGLGAVRQKKTGY